MQPFLVTASEALLLGRCFELYQQERECYGQRPDPPSTEEIEAAQQRELIEGQQPSSRQVGFRLPTDSEHMAEERKRWEEWNEGRQSILFLDFVDAELNRYLPSRSEFTTETSDQPPFDVEWLSHGDSEIGYSSSEPTALFYKAEGATFRATHRRVEKTLDVLITEWLGDAVAKSLFDHLRYAAPEEWARLQFEAVRKSQDEQFFRPRTGDDDPATIFQKLESFVGEDQKGLFATGRLFGKLESTCKRYLSRLMSEHRGIFEEIGDLAGAVDYGYLSTPDWVPDYLSAEFDSHTLRRHEWREQSLQQLIQLLAEDYLAVGGLAAIPLQQQVDLLREERTEDPLKHRYDLETFEQMLDAQRLLSALQFALGELVGRNWDQDTRRLQEDARSHDPRMAKLHQKASADRVRGQMEMVDLWFRQGHAPIVSPANIIGALGNAIEALTRRCWPESFFGSLHGRSLSDVLRERLKSNDELEQKFASLALSLYRFYRNPTSHDIDNATVTWTELLHFRSGIRVLLDISEELAGEGQKLKALTGRSYGAGCHMSRWRRISDRIDARLTVPACTSAVLGCDTCRSKMGHDQFWGAGWRL